MDVSVVTLFCTQEHGILLQDCYPKPSGLQALLALDVPYYYFSCKVRTQCSASSVGGLSHTGYSKCFQYVFLNTFLVSLFASSLFLMLYSVCVFGLTHPQLLFRRGGVFLPEVSVCPPQSVQKASVFLTPSSCGCVCLVLQFTNIEILALSAAQVHP